MFHSIRSRYFFIFYLLLLYRVKRPIILDRQHYITNLILSSYHIKYHHQFDEAVVNELRQKFWVTNLRAAVSNIKKECKKCRNDRVIPLPPEMAPIPAERIEPFHTAFHSTGMDFFGPFYVSIRRSREKRYGVIFTCMVSRAVHL